MVAEDRAEVDDLKGESAFMRLLDLNFEEVGSERVVAFFEANEDHHQPWGIVHGGVFSAVIETAATTGAYLAVKDEGRFAAGVDNVTDFLRPFKQGRLRVVAEPLQQAESQQLWQVIVERDEDGKTVARGQVRLKTSRRKPENLPPPGKKLKALRTLNAGLVGKGLS